VNLKPAKHVLKAIEDADLIVISPGSLYTSILPNLILPEVQSALKSTKAEIVYVCNLMTQKDEKRGYTAGIHYQAITVIIGIRKKVKHVVIKQENIYKQFNNILKKEI